VAYILKIRSNKIKLLTEFENVNQKVLFSNGIFATLISGGKYYVINQNGDYSRESNVRTLVFQVRVLCENTTSLQNSVGK
jgi:hypothetical protein